MNYTVNREWFGMQPVFKKLFWILSSASVAVPVTKGLGFLLPARMLIYSKVCRQFRNILNPFIHIFTFTSLHRTCKTKADAWCAFDICILPTLQDDTHFTCHYTLCHTDKGGGKTGLVWRQVVKILFFWCHFPACSVGAYYCIWTTSLNTKEAQPFNPWLQFKRH